MAYVAQEWTISGLAVELRMDRRTIGKALTGVDPVRSDNKTDFYLMADVVRAMLEQKTGTGDPQKEQARLNKLRADQIEMALAKDRREYLPVELLESALSEFARQAKAIFETLPKRLKQANPALKAREIRVIETELNKARQAVADMRLGKNDLWD